MGILRYTCVRLIRTLVALFKEWRRTKGYFMEDILKKIRERRKEKNYSQEDIARRLGVQRQAYNLRENGKVSMSMGEMEIVCKVLELTILVVDNELIIK